ncbi:MAG: 50S ribosome-binding GTPase, partial [Ignavibacteria bacterium]|nr:50S ribosome-binding GTPase [Ignavibacteria bacterium]
MKINYKDSEVSVQASIKDDLPPVSNEKNSATVALVGNPNVGKSLVFNYMSGIYVDVSNFPGTTVSITTSMYKDYKIIDTPGIYGISAFNDEEKVARSVIIESEIILNIVDAVHLERDLFLTLQLIDMGKKVSVLLNMMDEVAKHKIRIDSKKLSDLLGVEVYEMSAINGDGFENLENAILKARVGKRDKFILSKINEVLSVTKSDSEALLLIEGDKEPLKIYKRELDVDLREKIYITRRNRINEIIDQVETEKTKKGYILSKIGHLSLNQFTGVPILILILIATYFFIGDLVSQRLVKFTEEDIGKKQFEFWTKTFVSKFTEIKLRVYKSEDGALLKEYYFPNGTSKNPLMHSEYEQLINQNDTDTEFIFYQFLPKLLFGEFGIITMTITYLVFLLLP